MLNTLKKCWQTGEYGDQLKEIVLCPIRKLGHDPLLPLSFRPISLTPCVTKIFENMLKRRLEHFCERNQGALGVVGHLVTYIQCSLTQNKYLMCIFVDLKEAYGAINLGFLAKGLYELGLSENVSRSIVKLYQNKKIYIRDESNQLHGQRFTSLGILQGSILSPLLFNIYARHLHGMFKNAIKMY